MPARSFLFGHLPSRSLLFGQCQHAVLCSGICQHAACCSASNLQDRRGPMQRCLLPCTTLHRQWNGTAALSTLLESGPWTRSSACPRSAGMPPSLAAEAASAKHAKEQAGRSGRAIGRARERSGLADMANLSRRAITDICHRWQLPLLSGHTSRCRSKLFSLKSRFTLEEELGAVIRAGVGSA